MNTLRTFVALPLHEAIKSLARNLQNDLKKLGLDVKWVDPVNIHVTLKFLGDTPEDQIPLIGEIIKETFHDLPPFSLRTNRLGTFPDPRRAKVIWLGFETDKGILREKVGLLERKLEAIRFRREARSFSPHITLGRVKSSRRLFQLPEALEMDIPVVNEKVESIVLFKSTLTPQGSVYEVLKEIKLICPSPVSAPDISDSANEFP